MSSYGRVRADDVAPTMTTRCTTPACGAFVHPTEHRGLTLREAATFQTFPPDYVFEGGYDAVERQIGNAEPVRMAHALGLSAACWATRRQLRPTRLSRSRPPPDLSSRADAVLTGATQSVALNTPAELREKARRA